MLWQVVPQSYIVFGKKECTAQILNTEAGVQNAIFIGSRPKICFVYKKKDPYKRTVLLSSLF